MCTSWISCRGVPVFTTVRRNGLKKKHLFAQAYGSTAGTPSLRPSCDAPESVHKSVTANVEPQRFS